MWTKSITRLNLTVVLNEVGGVFFGFSQKRSLAGGSSMVSIGFVPFFIVFVIIGRSAVSYRYYKFLTSSIELDISCDNQLSCSVGKKFANVTRSKLLRSLLLRACEAIPRRRPVNKIAIIWSNWSKCGRSSKSFCRHWINGFGRKIFELVLSEAQLSTVLASHSAWNFDLESLRYFNISSLSCTSARILWGSRNQYGISIM